MATITVEKGLAEETVVRFSLIPQDWEAIHMPDWFFGLDPKDRQRCLQDLFQTLINCISTGDYDSLRKCIDDWIDTAVLWKKHHGDLDALQKAGRLTTADEFAEEFANV
jgi:hypothetical protein